MNLRAIPGTDYPITKIFGYLPMSADSPYRCPWWYRNEFVLPQAEAGRTWLHFDGLNYRANVWLNGKQVAASDDIAGAFRTYDLDVSDKAVRGGLNVLAVEVFAQTENDLGIDFLDWNPSPADKSMGLWRGVTVSTSGAVTIRNPSVATSFLKDDLSEAELSISADIANHGASPALARVSASIVGKRIEQTIALAAGEMKPIHFTAASFAALRVSNPPVWWPYQYGIPHLESLKISVAVDGAESDTKAVNFGIREISAALNKHGFLQFQVNRRDLLIRGGGWTPDLFYREPRERLRQELTYVKDMNLNTIRLEGKLGTDDLFDLADEMGILVMAGWQCCDAWQKWDKWTADDHKIASASTYSQVSRLRAHPSLLVWLNGSDEVPSPEVEADFLAVLKERDWPDPILSTAADRSSKISGPSGVKMTGPYDYVPPEYWYLDTDRLGGAFGFNTETSPGPAVPTIASVQRTLPKASWWPIDEQWKYHAGLGKFAQYDNFTRAMEATYGTASTLAEFSLKAQLMAYDGERAMFEAYGANKYRATGVIQWMLNNAWPSFIWHLYDYYLVPGGGYYGTKKANEPLHVQYRYDDRTVVVVNSSLSGYRRLRAKATLVGLDGQAVFTQQSALDIGADGVIRLYAIPPQRATVFLKLELDRNDGMLLSQNFYWIPAALARLDWAKSTYVNTPALSYADMRDLSTLPRVAIHADVQPGKVHGEATVSLRNTGRVVAFFISLRAAKAGTDEDLVPIFWNDNYVSLLPGESKVLTVRGVRQGETLIQVQGWNVQPQTLSW
jgi:exo-1,4-beta-D-glucosaminidase